jgi:hypothetical protein
VGIQYLKEVEGRVYSRVQDFMAPLHNIVEDNLNAFSYWSKMHNDLPSIS